MHNCSHTDCQATPHLAEHASRVEGQKTFAVNSPNRLFSHEDRTQFYTGYERMSLPLGQVQRVRELQEANDDLQRQVMKNEKELLHAHDALTILSEVERCNIMIARNTGEILNIYAVNEARLRRIAELEAQNINLQGEMGDIQGQFITCHEMNQKTKYAAEFFAKKTEYDKNLLEIRHLNQH